MSIYGTIRAHIDRARARLGTTENAVMLGAAASLCIGLLIVALSPAKAVAVIIGAALLIATFVKPEWAIMLLAAYTPFEPFLLKFFPDDVYVFVRYAPEVLVYVIFAAVVMRVLMREKKYAATPIDLPFALFLFTALASLLINAVPPLIGLLGVRQIIRFIVLFFAVMTLAPDDAFTKRLTKMMLVIVTFEGLLGAAQALLGGSIDAFLLPSDRKFFESIQLTTGTSQTWSPGTRVFATLGRYDQLGTFLCLFFLLTIGLLYVSRDKEERLPLLAVLGLSAFGFVMTLSRASWFGLLLGVIVIGAWLMRDARLRISFVVGAALLAAYVAWSGIAISYLVDYPGQTVVERFFEAFSYDRWRGEYYGLGRLFWIVQTPTVVVPSSPFFGVGPGQYGGGAAAALANTRVYEKLNLPFGVYGTEGYIDNNWFSLWGETGTLGLIFYGWMFVAIGAAMFRIWNRAHDRFFKGLALGFIGVLAAVTLQAFLATYLEVRTLALYFWLYAALIFVHAKREHAL